MVSVTITSMWYCGCQSLWSVPSVFCNDAWIRNKVAFSCEENKAWCSIVYSSIPTIHLTVWRSWLDLQLWALWHSLFIPSLCARSWCKGRIKMCFSHALSNITTCYKRKKKRVFCRLTPCEPPTMHLTPNIHRIFVWLNILGIGFANRIIGELAIRFGFVYSSICTPLLSTTFTFSGLFKHFPFFHSAYVCVFGRNFLFNHFFSWDLNHIYV